MPIDGHGKKAGFRAEVPAERRVHRWASSRQPPRVPADGAGAASRSPASRLPLWSPEDASLHCLRPALEWQRPSEEPAADALLAGDDFQFADPDVSDLPPEIDIEQLPRWMRAVPEQGPHSSHSKGQFSLKSAKGLLTFLKSMLTFCKRTLTSRTTTLTVLKVILTSRKPTLTFLNAPLASRKTILTFSDVGQTLLNSTLTFLKTILTFLKVVLTSPDVGQTPPPPPRIGWAEPATPLLGVMASPGPSCGCQLGSLASPLSAVAFPEAPSQAHRHTRTYPFPSSL